MAAVPALFSGIEKPTTPGTPPLNSHQRNKNRTIPGINPAFWIFTLFPFREFQHPFQKLRVFSSFHHSCPSNFFNASFFMGYFHRFAITRFTVPTSSDEHKAGVPRRVPALLTNSKIFHTPRSREFFDPVDLTRCLIPTGMCS
jgi:hypothetical protein